MHNIQWEMYNNTRERLGTKVVKEQQEKKSFCEQATRGGGIQNSFRIFHVYLSMTQDFSGIYLSMTSGFVRYLFISDFYSVLLL